MKKFLGVITILAVIFSAGAAFSGPKAPSLEGGGKIAIFILLDSGITDNMNERRERVQNRVGEWMEKDLVNMFNKAGYEAKLIQSSGEYTPGAGKYLLKVTIVKFHSSTAARVFGGIYTPNALMNARYELADKGDKPVFTYEDEVVSSRDWKRVARKLNENALKRITEKMNEMHK